MSSCRRKFRSAQSGLTLLEVLIAVLVLSVGLLGVAGLQLAGLKNGQQSYQRSQVSILAYEMADRMRANRSEAYVGSYVIDNTGVGAAPALDCSTAACTTAELAAWDRYDWYMRHLLATLPSATARIQCASDCSRGTTQQITIAWDENRTGATDNSCTNKVGDASYNPNNDQSCFTISFAP